ncbi:MAG: hypothetical protein HY042_04515, partial [Spirochaetia bacterium]|nr:hypothetical protein [Spirochaetia bacterium]
IKKGIILFQSGRYTDAAAAFNRAVENYPSGTYTEKARDWQKETEAQIRDRSQFEDSIPSSGKNQTPDK